MWFYHMTSINNLTSISQKGLIPQNGDNGKLIGENKVKVYFSEGFSGAIALFVDYWFLYNDIKQHNVQINDNKIYEALISTENVRDFLGEGVYLCFEGSGIINERNFENGCTDKIIPPEDLYVCIIKNKQNNNIVFSRFEIVKYMMSVTNPENIIYYGTNYENAPESSRATARIQSKIKRYYNSHQSEIDNYFDTELFLDYIPLKDFLKQYKKFV